MKKSDLKEMDLVLTRDKCLYIILDNKFHKGLGLYNYDMDCVAMLSSYSDNLITSDHDNDIVGVVRGETKWYQLIRLREFEYSSRKGEDILRYSRNWKWIWKLGNINVESTSDLENIMFYSSDLTLKDAKKYVVYGRDIKKILERYIKTNCIVYKNINDYELKQFIDHYYLSDYTISDDKKYIVFKGREEIVCKKWEEDL